MTRRWLNDATTIITALVSSSCCIVQLVLNIFSYSCAGFAIFTPYRSYLTTITVILLSFQFYKNGWKNPRVWTTTFLSLLLMVTPEIVSWLNVNTTKTTTMTTDAVMLHLDGLGCLACANRIKNALTTMDWVESASVFFDNSSAWIQYKVGGMDEAVDKKKVAASLIQVIKNVDSKYNAFLITSAGTTSKGS
ncbi:hypothetical protein BDA99DRAFT_566701 [Phascolomyces articulosus]|uniref:HMA domain-containing protein n=1 Tax=Phascolomyces articulosus TaxID=60185 RepID=A0AAD5P754_9FUNG|nr:hypothetical protein BDA99DRAFT_566701 [Phascolomyces articulosus]